MRILVLTNRYPPAAVGGYELSCRDVAVRLVERGHQVLILTSAPGQARVMAGVQVWPQLPASWDGGQAPPVWHRPAVARRARKCYDRAVASFRPEVVSIWNPTGLPGSLVAALPGGPLPTVWTFADAWPERVLCGDPWLAPFVDRPRLGRVVGWVWPTHLPDLGRAGTLCFCSAHLRDRVATLTGWSMDRSVVVPLGADPRDFPPRASARPGWDWRLLFVGRLDPGKGVDTVIEALSLLPDQATLRIVGPDEGGHRARAEWLIRTLALAGRVRIDSAGRDQLAEIYGAADVCVFPSQWPEPFGIVPLEAMACATPVVATGVGGSAEYLRGGDNCLLFAPGDAARLAAAIATLGGDAGLRGHLVAGGLRTAGELTVDRLTDRLEHLFEAAVRAGGCGTAPMPGP